MINGITVTQGMTTPSKPGKAPRPVWQVGGNLTGLESSLYDLGGKKYLGSFSFFSDPTADIEYLTEEDRLSYAERQERAQQRSGARAERLTERSSAHAAASDHARARSDSYSERFAGGQPILIGHHSEAGARRDQERSFNAMSKAVEESNYSEELARRAAVSEKKATGTHTAAFCDRRITDQETTLRDVRRKIAGGGTHQQIAAYISIGMENPNKPAEGEYLAKLQAAEAECLDAINYWKSELAALGGIKYSKDTIKKGDSILAWGQWRKVVRVNAKSVSAESGYTWTDTHIYSSIKGHRPA